MDEIIGGISERLGGKLGNKDGYIPTNVKQIGNIEGRLQVYLEDFVYSYLKELSSVDTSKEEVAILVGKYIQEDGKDILLIRGAIKGKETVLRKGSIVFTEKSWDKVYEEKEKYFSEEEIIGWVRSQPGFGIFLSGYDQEFHQIFFKEPYQLVYVIDPIEKTDAFFQWKEGQIKKMSGYFIYYDKNNCMHEYMIDHRIVPEKTEKDAQEEFIRQLRKQEKVKKAEKNYKKMIQSLVMLSSILVIGCIALGAGLYNTKSKVEKISSQYEALSIKLDVLSKETEKQAFKNQPMEQNDAENIKAVESVEATEQQEVNSKEDNTATEEKVVEEKVVEEKAVEEKVVEEKAVEEKAVEEKAVEEKAVAEKAVEKKAIETKPKVVYDIYEVKEGDSLLRIALINYGDGNMVENIMKENGMEDPDKIVIGQKIKLPKK